MPSGLLRQEIGAANGRRIRPVRPQVVRRIDALFDIERGINGKSTAEHRERSAPFLADLEAWLRDGWPRLSRSSSVAGSMNCMPK